MKELLEDIKKSEEAKDTAKVTAVALALIFLVGIAAIN